METILIFFLISKKDIYTKDYFKQEEHRASLESTRKRKQRTNIIENQTIEKWSKEKKGENH